MSKKSKEAKPEAAPEIKVFVERFRDRHTLLGPAKMIRDLDEIVSALHKSAFMDEFFKEKIREALLSGREFVCRSEDSGMPKSIYRLCTDDDVMSLAKDGTLNNAVSRASAAAFAGVGVGNKPRKKRGSFFRLGPVETVAMEAFNKLQTQGKIIYGIMRDHVGPLGGDIGRDEIRLVLEKRKSEIKTGQDVMRLFGFHMSQFYVKLGLVERVVEATGTETDETEAGDDE